MSEGINQNSKVNNQYSYSNPKLEKYDTDGDGSLSVFEIENIQDTEGIEILSQDLSQNINQETIDTQIKSLQDKLEHVKKEQGIISSAWNSIKCFTGLGSSTNKCNDAINDFKNGKITYEEADNIISGFSTKQKSSVNLAANILTGIAAVAVVGSAVMTGGLSLGVIGAAAGVGAATKAGLKFADRATNKIEGDALDGKQIAKDALTGAVDGAVAVTTMGMGSSAVTAKTVSEQTIKQTIIQGAKEGAKQGAISGAITGASDYTVEAALEEEVDFNINDMIKSSAVTAAGGAVAGGIMGGISNGIQYKNMDAKLTSRQAHHEKLSRQEIVELTDKSTELHKIYNKNVDQASNQVDDMFGHLSTVEKTSGRAKSENSIFEKLASKMENGQLKSLSNDDCIEAIADAYGTRIQIKSLTQAQSEAIIKDTLKDTDITYEQFIKYMDEYINKTEISSLDQATIDSISAVKKDVFNALKENQTDEVFQTLLKNIKEGKITVTELNNYGDELSSYFTQRQLNQIADYYNSQGINFDIVTKIDKADFSDELLSIDTKGKLFVEQGNVTFKDKAIKESGYSTSQMNTKHPFKNGVEGTGELQIRGRELSDFADIEHIPYDIKKGKIISSDVEYAPVYKLIKGLTKTTNGNITGYQAYNSYITQVYNWLRLKELGIQTVEPAIEKSMAGFGLSQEALNLLSREGLIKFSASLH